MNRFTSIFILLFINMGLLLAKQETPVVSNIKDDATVLFSSQDTLVSLVDVKDSIENLPSAESSKPVLTKALKDSIQERLKLARRFSTNTRSTNFKLARRHIERVLQLSDSLQLDNADYYAAAGDVEDLAFNFERNKPAMGGKMDEAACLLSAKNCYLYYVKAFDLYRADEERYGKAGIKQQQRLQQKGIQYYLQTNGFLVNAGLSYKKGDLKTTLEEFRLSFEGSISPFLCEAFDSDPKHLSAFETFLADSTQCRALYNCATVSSALGLMDESLAYYDSLKIRGYAPEKVYRNTLSIYSARRDTIMIMTELIRAIETMPEDTWFQKNLLQIYLDRRQWNEAEAIADRALSVDSLDAQTMCVRGQLYEMRGNIELAMINYLRSYELDSTQANVCSYIGRIHYNRAITVKNDLYNQRKFKQIDKEVQPIYSEALPWYQRAYRYDNLRIDASIPLAIREILYSRFTQAKCSNRTELIEEYNEVSRAYGLTEFASPS